MFYGTERVQNDDGSVNLMGSLTGLEKYSQDEFDARTFDAPSLDTLTYAYQGFTRNVYYNRQLVSQFADLTPSGGAFTFYSAEQGGITVKTVYDNNGILTGVEAVVE